MKNYNEAMFASMRQGIITTDENMVVVKVNARAKKLLNVGYNFVGLKLSAVLAGNEWVVDSVERVMRTYISDETLDASLQIGTNRLVSVNLSVETLHSKENEDLGCILIFEDITVNKRLRSTMARFLTKELTDRLLEGGELSLGGTLQKATILFSDIRGFTNFAERNGPQETVSMLNQYFTVMYEQIVNNSGMLDKYIGDAMMSVFGVPFSTNRDADNAVQTAIDMIKELDIFNKKRVESGDEPIRIGIGINTGEVVSGNIGSDKRMDYTVIGDGVNLAARLEGSTKLYKVSILISESTKDSLHDRYLLRELDWIRVKGKDEPIAIFEVVNAYEYGKIRTITENLEKFKEALGYYRKQEWEKGADIFLQLVYNAQDPVSALFLERCRYFQDNPPDTNWDGVWVMRTK
jgi:adenylate cyclase